MLKKKNLLLLIISLILFLASCGGGGGGGDSDGSGYSDYTAQLNPTYSSISTTGLQSTGWGGDISAEKYYFNITKTSNTKGTYTINYQSVSGKILSSGTWTLDGSQLIYIEKKYTPLMTGTLTDVPSNTTLSGTVPDVNAASFTINSYNSSTITFSK